MLSPLAHRFISQLFLSPALSFSFLQITRTHLFIPFHLHLRIPVHWISSAHGSILLGHSRGLFIFFFFFHHHHHHHLAITPACSELSRPWYQRSSCSWK
ncbi:hypothetical protein B0O80DRAFT_447704 [Mortierella sp. GBAus27b]|nr:hypothetical protein B0O80DRAFT_447704 [Mortierella sp. GBAus27b]